MKKSILFLMLIMGVTVFIGCEKTTWDESQITYYVDLTIEGDDVLFWDLNSPFIEPGYNAELKGEDFTDEVEVTSDLDVTESGIYTISYSATNEDGYAKVLSRTVIVCDPTPSVLKTGFYATNEDCFRVNDETAVRTVYGDTYNIIIFQTSPGVFFVTDFLGGYYDQRAGYGTNFAMTGYFTLNPDNTIIADPTESYVAGWEDRMDSFISGVYNPGTSTISWELLYAGVLRFNVTAAFAN